MFHTRLGYHDAITNAADLNSDLDLEGSGPIDPARREYVRGQVELISQVFCEADADTDPDTVKHHVYRAIVKAVAVEQWSRLSVADVDRVVSRLNG